MTAPPAPELVTVPLGLLDDPALPSRAHMDDAKLDALAESIRAIGLQQPIIAARVGERFEVIAGHRRRIACLRAGLAAAPCLVYPDKTTSALIIQAHENSRREDLNPADEAVWFAELFDTVCGQDIERLAGLVGETVSYVDSRLRLLSGDPRVLDALRRGQIRIGVARELNTCESDHYRNYFLSLAVREGATVANVAGWIAQWRASTLNTPPGATPAAEPEAPNMAPAADPFTCYCCGKSNNVHLIRQIHVHEYCRLAVLDELLGKNRDAS